MNMGKNLLTPGEKIRKIRRSFNIIQSDLTDGKITRNLISLIENNRAELKESTAKIIADSINRICKERNIDFTVTPHDLLMNNTMQADKMLDDLIILVNNNSNNKHYDFSPVINEAEKLIKHNPDLKKIIDFYLDLGDSFILRNDYWQAYVFYFKAYEHLDFKKQPIYIARTTIELSYCCNILAKFSETVQIINPVLSLNIKIPPVYKYKLILNKALAQKNLKEYMNSINSLHELDNIKLDNTHYFNVKILEANCYRDLGDFNNSLDIYYELYNEKYCNDSTKYLTVLCNIIDTYVNMNEPDKLRVFLNEAMNILKQPSLEINNHYSFPIYHDIENAALHMKSYDDAIIVLTKKLKEARESKRFDLQFDSLNNLFLIYLHKKEYNKLEYLKPYLMDLLNNDNKKEYHTLIYKYISMYSMQNKKEHIDSLVSYALNLNSKLKYIK